MKVKILEGGTAKEINPINEPSDFPPPIDTAPYYRWLDRVEKWSVANADLRTFEIDTTCIECDGNGWYVAAECCGNELNGGGCCGSPVEKQQECDFCNGTGRLIEVRVNEIVEAELLPTGKIKII